MPAADQAAMWLGLARFLTALRWNQFRRRCAVRQVANSTPAR